MLLVLDWEQKTDSGTNSSTWNALFIVLTRLHSVKQKFIKEGNVKLQLEGPKDLVKKYFGPAHKRTDMQRDSENNYFRRLPVEIIYQIISQLENDQESLSNLCMSSKRLRILVTPLLYKVPLLTAPSSIYKLLENLEKDPELPNLIKKVQFAPTLSQSLSHSNPPNPKFELLPYVHSGLFNVLINDREMISQDCVLVHPLFYRIARTLPNCRELEELGIHKENRSSLSQSTSSGKPQISRIPSSCLTLSFLLRTCQRWYSEFPEWNGLKDSVPTCYSTVIMLLDWLQGNYHSIWKLSGSSIRSIKPLLLMKCRSLLAHINSSHLLQVRFITGNSQRLLDIYCLIYYKTLSLAQGLDVQALSDCMTKPQSLTVPLLLENVIEEELPLLQTNSDEDGQIAVPTELVFSEREKKPSEEENLTPNQRAARCIYEAVTIIFHLRIPPELQTRCGIPQVPVELLREILVTYPPSTINAETVELITNLALVKLDPNDPTTPMLSDWQDWLSTIIVWHESSMEMDPVKDLLRKSMTKIDMGRELQRKYGIVFMDGTL